MKSFVSIALWLATVATTASAQTAAPASRTFDSQSGRLLVETIARGLENPWGLTFLPDGRMLVTERPGRVRLVQPDGQISPPLSGVPAVSARRQGGLLDIVVDPEFATTRQIFVTFAEPRSGGNTTAVARLRLNASATGFERTETIWRQEPVYNGGLHFGSRIVFDRTGALFVALGDRYDLKEEAQNPQNTLGKIVRIQKDGKPAPGNPGRAGEGTAGAGTVWLPEIWSIGHRNIQGAALHPVTGKLWTAEHGARGGDEINVPEAGKNYGWPVITYGRDYSGASIGEGARKAGMEQPLYYWDPSMAPSGMAFYTGDRFPAWRGNVFVGALAGQHVARLVLDGERVTSVEKLFDGLGRRIRDVRQGPDGFLYLLTDQADGEILRVRPASSP